MTGGTTGVQQNTPEGSLGGSGYFRKRFSKAWRASRGLEVEVSRSMVVRGE
jgi:hypothetical protein